MQVRNQNPGQDPKPDRGRDDEHRGGAGRPVKPSPSAPEPSKTLMELDFAFWHNITKP
jgi:hypothetical protein